MRKEIQFILNWPSEYHKFKKVAISHSKTAKCRKIITLMCSSRGGYGCLFISLSRYFD